MAMAGNPRSNRAVCIAWVLAREGGYVNNPHDKGKATNHGITLDTLANWRGKAVTPEDVQALSVDEAAAIYGAHFWEPMHCDALPPGVDLSVMDAGVMSGPSRGLRFLQGAAGVTDDGVWGPHTNVAVCAAQPADLVRKIADARDAYYVALTRTNPNDQEFLRGWQNRVADTQARALEMTAA